MLVNKGEPPVGAFPMLLHPSPPPPSHPAPSSLRPRQPRSVPLDTICEIPRARTPEERRFPLGALSDAESLRAGQRPRAGQTWRGHCDRQEPCDRHAGLRAPLCSGKLLVGPGCADLSPIQGPLQTPTVTRKEGASLNLHPQEYPAPGSLPRSHPILTVRRHKDWKSDRGHLLPVLAEGSPEEQSLGGVQPAEIGG